MRELYRGMVHQPDLTPASLELSANGVYDARHRIHRDRDIHPPTRDLLTDDEYADLQNVLVENPERGDIIRGSGGLRKLCASRCLGVARMAALE